MTVGKSDFVCYSVNESFFILCFFKKKNVLFTVVIT